MPVDPPGLLKDDEFEELQSLLGYGYEGLVKLQSCLESGRTRIVHSLNPVVEGDMLYPFHRDAERTNVLVTDDLMVNAARALVLHVRTRNGTTMNQYLVERGLKVTRSFSALLSGLGYLIYPANIDG